MVGDIALMTGYIQQVAVGRGDYRLYATKRGRRVRICAVRGVCQTIPL
jgi:hypothetical protein